MSQRVLLILLLSFVFLPAIFAEGQGPDLDAAIQAICEHHQRVYTPNELSLKKSRCKNSFPYVRVVLTEDEQLILLNAYRDLTSQYAKKTITVDQKDILVPVLIFLCLDETVTLDQSPGDGPEVPSSTFAVQALLGISGRNANPPLLPWDHRNRVGHIRENGKLRRISHRKAHELARERQQDWQSWWEEQKKDRAKNGDTLSKL